MKEKIITVTEAARNFAECINQAHYQNISFVLLKNGRPMARLEPAEEKRCTGRELAEVLAKVKLTPEESRAWYRDLQKARKTVKTPADKWQ